MNPDLRERLKQNPVLWVKWCYEQGIDLMNYKTWLRSLRGNPFHPRSKRVMRRRLGRYIRRFEKKYGRRSEFRNIEMAKQFGGKF